ncbi:MAG: hypothetical protein QNI90_03235 [Dinoroseobacter sp.]|nr:hypothetical protein [Dinoroseobacter sp.]
MAFFFLNLPPMFWIGATYFTVKAALETWAWTKLPSDEKRRHKTPGRLMSSNHALPVWIEWICVGIGFFAFKLWVP